MELIDAEDLDPSHPLIICGMNGMNLTSKVVKYNGDIFGIVCPGLLLTAVSPFFVTSEIIRLFSKTLTLPENITSYKSFQSCLSNAFGQKLNTTDSKRCYSSKDPCLEKYNLSKELLKLTCEKE